MKKLLIIIISDICLLLCFCGSNDTFTNHLELSFLFNNASDNNIQASFQTAVWLEDTLGQYIQTLFLSEYLSYGGYNDSTICPDWSSKSDWDNSSEEMCDAVTKATPLLGNNILTFEINEIDFSKAPIVCYIQTHIVENYNIKSRCIINPDLSVINPISVEYYPTNYPGAEFVLDNVNTRILQ